MKRQAQGFTLIEVLVAIAIFAFVAAISYSTLSNTLIVRERTEKFNQELSDLQLAIQIIDKDFRQIINRPIRDPSGGDIDRPAFSLGGSDYLVEFTRTGWPNPLEQPRNELQRLAYKLDENKLIRSYWSQLDRASNSEAIDNELLLEVDEFTVSALDDQDTPQNFWPVNSSNSSLLPKAVEIVIKSSRWGEIRRVYEVIQ